LPHRSPGRRGSDFSPTVCWTYTGVSYAGKARSPAGHTEMRHLYKPGAILFALVGSAGCSCSRGLRVAHDAAKPETGISESLDAAGPSDRDAAKSGQGETEGPDTRSSDTEVFSPGPGADARADAGALADSGLMLSEVGVDVPARAADAVAAGPDATVAPPEVGPDGALVVWTGPDAVVRIGAPPTAADGGSYPQVYAFPGTAVVSHAKLFSTEPDTVFRIDELGDVSCLDLNRDRLADVVVSTRTAISFYLQGPSGTFRAIPGIALAAGGYHDRFALDDLNQDGLLDVVLSYHSRGDDCHGQLAVFLQTAAGFADTADQLISVSPSSGGCASVHFLSIAEMNGDGRLDLVALTRIQPGEPTTVDCSCGTNMVQVFVQDSTGSFPADGGFAPAPSSTACAACSAAIAVGDLDLDGRSDLAILQDGVARPDTLPRGFETLIHTRAGGEFSAEPTQVLRLSQFLATVRLVDSNGDGRLDVLVRPGKNDLALALPVSTPGLSGVFLQQDDGRFAAARTLAPDGWLPAGTDVKTQALGLDIRDFDGDRIRDLVLERNGVAEGLFRQEGGSFATTPDVEIQALFPDLVAASQQTVTVDFLPTDGGSTRSSGRFNQLAYTMADMDGDQRQDVVVAYVPFAPNLTPDPESGKYPSAGFRANTYTELRIHRQRPMARRFLVAIEHADVAVERRLLHVRATIANLDDVPAEDVRVRVLAASSPATLSYTQELLAANFDSYAEWGRDNMLKFEDRIKGAPLGADILVPRIEAGAAVPLAIDVSVPLVDLLDPYCLFVVVDPDTNDNLLYKRVYDFIAPLGFAVRRGDAE
jgi:hypothetical protein